MSQISETILIETLLGNVSIKNLGQPFIKMNYPHL